MWTEQERVRWTGSGAACLRAAIQAASLAIYANRTGDKALPRAARTHFGSALRGVQAALHDPKEVVRDETLTAVTLLGMYEVWLTY